VQFDAEFLATWNRMLTLFAGDYSGGGVVYSGTTHLTLAPYQGGTGAARQV
jgi:hypothetical protein